MENYFELIYLLSSISFILGLKFLSDPKTARRGNLLAAAGMIAAVIAVFFDGSVNNRLWIIGGVAIGTVIGFIMAKRVKMTDMPQMVSFFNGMGGACAAIISVVEFSKISGGASTGSLISICFGLLIGGISFSGSMVAFGKLQGIVTDKSVVWPGQRFINLLIILSVLALSAFIISSSSANDYFIYILLALSLIFGVLFVLPIGGADMPVVISLLNSFTGVAASFAGFLFQNKVMLIGGILVGSAGTILTVLMCHAMNRSLMNVLLGNFAAPRKGDKAQVLDIKQVAASDAAYLMKYANRVIIIPGYGMAVAQAQHACHELEKRLEESGVEVKYAIHPVAGRMPGHMNILLAESNVSYDKLFDLDEINDDFANTDVVFVVGANDVVNPAARHNPASPIYGMPILNADYAKTVIINKRSMAAGYAGIDNELFGYPNALMYFGDAKDAITRLVNELKNL
jgi:NAD(P) transhydrogenase subunit beta